MTEAALETHDLDPLTPDHIRGWRPYSSTIHRIFKDDLGMRPDRLRPAQRLREADFGHRISYCQEIGELWRNDDEFLAKLLFSDET